MIYCKQIAPEYQESRIFDDDGNGPEYINVTGNRNYFKRTSVLFDRVQNVLKSGELAEVFDALDARREEYYRSATQAACDLLEPEKGKYSTRDIHALKGLVRAYAECSRSEEDGILCRVLSIVTGREWDYRQISGCCQGDWQYVYYPVDAWTKEALDAFEIMYFNTGSEWIIHDEEGTPEKPEDIIGYSVYCTAQDEEGIRLQLADAAGVGPEMVKMWAFEEFAQRPLYKAV